MAAIVLAIAIPLITAAPAEATAQAVTTQTLAQPAGISIYWATTIGADGSIVGRANHETEFQYWRAGQPHTLPAYWTINGLNDRGQYAITEYSSGVYRALRQESDGSRVLLDSTPNTSAYAINNGGSVLVGRFGTAESYSIWSAGTLRTVPAASPIAAGAVAVQRLNDSGQLVFVTDQRLWRCDLAQCVELPVPAGYTIERVVDLDNSGRIVGNLSANGVTHPAMWTGTSVRLLNTDGRGGWVNDLNNQGYAVGRMNTATSGRAVLWGSGTFRIQLAPAAATNNGATAVNDQNDVVFYDRQTINGRSCLRAYLWRSGEVIALPPSEGDNSYPYDIADNGKVVGTSWATQVMANYPPPIGESYRATLWTTS
ncbi:hypothetical protein SAMN05192558_11883 [Actinokineospora alba]|uniref:Uncharacterized protein n=1 Tax=Actinokineospora alba TaxID=504798 RepID=A0A1H0W822_9PSEU|nr:hypothetical protein [Actinokineospora alba]TDP69972.1 hypothetical protein C8E96_5571 [Actinokineospora alba]SDJ50793.1 hypothetical protein SAMN05421871_11783 [Actinokineospora alba]SDP86890.1 hypothetical protein SAMN05192558_11883 [Actinokineospora alba]